MTALTFQLDGMSRAFPGATAGFPGNICRSRPRNAGPKAARPLQSRILAGMIGRARAPQTVEDATLHEFGNPDDPLLHVTDPPP